MLHRGPTILAALAFLAASSFAPTAARAADTMVSGLEIFGVLVEDEQLSEMRGKFVSPQGVTFFGLEMQTSWQTADGITTQAKLAINIDFAASGGLNRNTAPQMLVSWNREKADGSMDVPKFSAAAGSSLVAVTANGAIPVGGLNGTNGAVQSIQIAGADNNVRNSTSIAIVPSSSSRPDTTGMTAVTGSSTRQFADGDKVNFILGGNEVGLVLTNGSSDRVSQSVSGNLNQLSQHVRLGSDFNAISNGINLVIGYDTAADANQINAANAMAAIKNFGL